MNQTQKSESKEGSILKAKDVSPNPKVTQGGQQEMMPGIEAPKEQRPAPRTWGEVRIQKMRSFFVNDEGVLHEREPKEGELSMDLWVDIDVAFPSGSMQDAEQYLEKMLQKDEAVGGRYQIIRRVKTVEARVETIRRVQLFDVGEKDGDSTD